MDSRRGCGPISGPGPFAEAGSNVTSGEFDWVLSKIEQDDAYWG